MKIIIKGQTAALTDDDTLVQNSAKRYEVVFSFDESWSGYVKTALFEAGEASIAVVLMEDRCLIPAECLKQGGVILRVGVYGVKGEDRRATVWCRTSTILYSGELDIGGRPNPDEPVMPEDLYKQIMAAIGDLAAAGFEGKNLAEAIGEIKNGIAETATDAEVDSIIDSAFGPSSGQPEEPEEEGSNNTATDAEVDEILNNIFG